MREPDQYEQPQSDKTSKTKPQLRSKKLICLFGLSADPPTGYGGHVGIVQTLQQQRQWDEIWVMPVYRHTYKEKRERLVSFEHRFRMCQLAFAPLNIENVLSTPPHQQTKIIISDAEYMSWNNAVKDIADETERENISVGTAALLDYLSTIHEDYNFYFCLGADSFIDLVNGKWQQTDRILNELLFNSNDQTSDRCYNNYRRRLVVLYRTQSKMLHENETLTTITSDGGTIHPRSSATRSSEYMDHLQTLVEEFGVQLLHMDRSEDNISSTFVRNCSDVSRLRDNPAVILPEVLQYIQQHNIYRFCK